MAKKFVWMFVLLLQQICLPAQQFISLASPDGTIQFNFQLKNNKPVYGVSYKGSALIADAELGLKFETAGFEKFRILIARYRTATETYKLVVGKKKFVNDPFREVIIPLEETTHPNRKIHLIVRAFNDGLAFMYSFPQQKNWNSFALTDENSTFRFVKDPKVLGLFLPGFTTSHEGEYTSFLLSHVKEDTLMDMPALFQFPGNVYVAITEAALRDYAGMYLVKQKGVLTSTLSPLPGARTKKIKVEGKIPGKTPWRVLMISNRIGTLIESTIITSLNQPNQLKDVSWIKPGKTTFPWWNGSIIPDTTFAPGNNFENNKYYIDFCARNGIEYHTVVESGGHEWYTNDGQGYQPGPNADVTKPVAGLDMKQICDYAKSKGVAVRVWVHWKALYPKIDTAFAVFENWGLTGMMVDFMDRDDQKMIQMKEEILVKAAQHKLHIQFHGVEKPTGLSRTYPNELTREGTLNYEVNKWEKRITPDHDLNIVFTRMLAGPTDYHMGGFRAVPDSLFAVQFERPLMLGTRCHMLAMYVVLESYLGMVCDYPAAYEGQAGFDFVKKVPTVWDDTKVLNASVSEYITIARKKSDEWFVGSINNHEARKLKVLLDFLNEGEYVAEIFSDSDNVDKDPNQLVTHKRTVRKSDNLTFQLAAGGGCVMHIRKK
ncbi:MAG TPA: glycoside hydrolase family 97 protein [Flavitalea sp.]|nr:glycoside hydrolase family 97 protein [Flavitalea sp.]